MSLKPMQRFKVLSRDRFTCAYCGRSAPAVELVVDHIIPKSHGGTDRYDNLTAACFECNAGKYDALLHGDDDADFLLPDVESMAGRLELLRQRRRLAAECSAERHAATLDLLQAWDEMADQAALGRTTWRGSRRRYLLVRALAATCPLWTIREAMAVVLSEDRTYMNEDAALCRLREFCKGAEA